MDIEKGAVWIPFNVMEHFMRDVFVGLGAPKADAAICANVLISADQLGFDSHGISRLKPSTTTGSSRASSSPRPASASSRIPPAPPSSTAATAWGTSSRTRP